MKREINKMAIALILFIIAGCHSVEESKTTTLKMPELKNIQDGVYTGQYQGQMVSTTVEVVVKENRIGEVRLLDHATLLGKKAEVLTDQITERQTVELDAVSGATASSHAILRATENALNKVVKKESN